MLTELQKIGLVYETWMERQRYPIPVETLKQLRFTSDFSKLPDVAPWGFWVYANMFCIVNAKGHLITINQLEQLDPAFASLRYKWNDDNYSDYDLMSEIGWVRVAVTPSNVYYNAVRPDYVSRTALTTINDIAALYNKVPQFSRY